MSEYGLVEPFDCDDPMFCLGVEWEMFRQRLNATAEPFTMTISKSNAERLSAMCERRGRFVEVQPCPIAEGFAADHFEEWRVIMVGQLKQSEDAGSNPVGS